MTLEEAHKMIQYAFYSMCDRYSVTKATELEDFLHTIDDDFLLSELEDFMVSKLDAKIELRKK